MTTAIIHGDPGSYKTSSLVSDYLVSGLKQGRVIVTNIRGVKTPEETALIYGFELPDSSQIINVSFDEDGFEKMARFFHWVPEGSLILMDEGQRVYPTRLRDFKLYDLNDPKSSRPKTVEDAFDSHRHMNWDIYISTPNIGKVHKEIRAVAEYGYRHKNLATVFSFMKGRYKRVTHNAENSGASLTHAISSSIKKIDKRCFDVYESTATGKTKDSQAGVSFFKQPKILFLLCVLLYSIWNMGSTYHAAGGLPAMFGGHSTQQTVSLPSSAAQAPSSNVSFSSPVGGPDQNPFRGLVIYLVGSINNSLLFQVTYPDNTYIQLSEGDMKAFGFEVARLTQSVVKLTFLSESTFIFSKPKQEKLLMPRNGDILSNNPMANL